MKNPAELAERPLDAYMAEKQRKRDVKEMYKKALGTMRECVIRPDDFVELYGDQVEDDINQAKKYEEKFNKENTEEDKEAKRYAETLEAILIDQIEMSDWMGPNAYTYKTSTFDDYFNQVDGIVEFMEGENASSYLGLAVDATYKHELDDKIISILKKIEKGEMAKIKYFKSSNMNFRGELSNLPKVIIGADFNNIYNLGKLWIEKGKKKEMGSHPMQYIILQEIVMQLHFFSKYAKECSQREKNLDLAKRKEEIAHKYRVAAEKFEKIYQDKEKAMDKDRVKEYHDSVFREIQRKLLEYEYKDIPFLSERH